MTSVNNAAESPEYVFGFASDAGRKRRGEPNQDALDVILGVPPHAHPPLLIVADGLGGYGGGAVASHLVLQVFRQVFTQADHPANYLKLLELCAHKAHTEIRLAGSRDTKLSNMGSTVVAAVLEAERFYILNVGDSRAYIVRGSKMLQVSEDHSWVATQIRKGLLTKQEALAHPNRNRLSMAITAKRPDIKPYVAEEVFGPTDILVLCSDGLWGVIPETLIWAAASELAPQVAAEKLVALANRSQSPDNISVLVARRFDPDRKSTSISVEDTSPGL